MVKLLPLAPLLAWVGAFNQFSIAHMEPVITFVVERLVFFRFLFEKNKKHFITYYLTFFLFLVVSNCFRCAQQCRVVSCVSKILELAFNQWVGQTFAAKVPYQSFQNSPLKLCKCNFDQRTNKPLRHQVSFFHLQSTWN